MFGYMTANETFDRDGGMSMAIMFAIGPLCAIIGGIAAAIAIPVWLKRRDATAPKPACRRRIAGRLTSAPRSPPWLGRRGLSRDAPGVLAVHRRHIVQKLLGRARRRAFPAAAGTVPPLRSRPFWCCATRAAPPVRIAACRCSAIPSCARWTAMSATARGIFLVSTGSLTLVAMAMLIKQLGARIPAVEILFFRSAVGFLFVLPFFWRNPLEPIRTKRHGAHLIRGIVGTLGNLCFFWTVTHMLLADAVALQFSRPLFMLPLAVLFLGESRGPAPLADRRGRLHRHSGLRAAVHRRLRPRRPGRRRRRGVLLPRGDLHQVAREDRADPRHHVLLLVLDGGVLRDPGAVLVGDADADRACHAGRGRRPRHLRPGHW